MNKFLKIEEKRVEQVLPSHIKKSNVLSDNAKKVFAALLDLHFSLDEAKKLGYVYLSNDELRKILQMQKNAMLNAVKELIELKYPLIRRVVGKSRSKGEKATATSYYINWDNINKPIEKLSFEGLKSQFLKSLKTPSGTADTDADTDVDIDTDIDTDIEIDIEKEIELDKDKEIDKDKEKDNIKQENELIEENEKPIEINFVSENDFESKEKSFERKGITNNIISSIKENQYFEVIKQINKQNAVECVLQENTNNINSNNSMNKETLKKEIELFNVFENELFKCSTYEQVEALREKLFDWFMRITDNNSKVLKTEYLETIKQFICKLDTKALKTPTTALNVQGEQIPSNDNLKPTEDKEKTNDEQANKTTSNDTNTKENHLQNELNETQKAGNTPTYPYAVQCGELQSQGNIKPTESKEMALNEEIPNVEQIISDTLNMLNVYDERICKVESIESVERLYNNCKAYLTQWGKKYLEILPKENIEFIKTKFKQIQETKNDRITTLKYKMVHNYN